VCGGVIVYTDQTMEPPLGLPAFRPRCSSYLGPGEALGESPQGVVEPESLKSQLQCPEWSWACTGVGVVGYVPRGRIHLPPRTRNWGWRASWSKILSLTRIPSHIDGGDVCQDCGGDGGGGGDDGGWGPWVGDCVAFGAGPEVHSVSAVDLPQTPEGLGS
jgi:hypothetical protein